MIKEVADVILFKIEDDGTETPWLYLDSLKVSTIEQTADQVEARGGKGNSPLIIWDFNKEINLTLEDALYTPRSMALMFGGNSAWEDGGTTAVVSKYFNWTPDATATEAKAEFEENGVKWTTKTVYNASGSAVSDSFAKGETYLCECTATAKKHATLTIGADDFPGTFKLVGDTYARNRNTGNDEYFRFIINRAKMSAEETLTLEAEGKIA